MSWLPTQISSKHHKKDPCQYRPRACKISFASATRLSPGDPCLHAVVPSRVVGISTYKHSRMLYCVSARRRGFPSHDYSWFGFIGNVCSTQKLIPWYEVKQLMCLKLFFSVTSQKQKKFCDFRFFKTIRECPILLLKRKIL